MKCMAVIGVTDNGCLADLAYAAAACFQGVSKKNKQISRDLKPEILFY